MIFFSGNMKSTPFVQGKYRAYSRLRTSKVTYMNEHRFEMAKQISNKIQHALRVNLYNRLFASENYQVMNYGIGGRIEAHVDSRGLKSM